MKFLIDSIDLKEVKDLIKHLPISGVTSNPSIVKQVAPKDFFGYMKKLKEAIGDRELHVQVISTDYDGILKDAELIASQLGKDTFIKVPVSYEGTRAIKALKKKGYNVTATAVYTLAQAYMALEAGADYIAPYTNRIENLGSNPYDLAYKLRENIDEDKSSCKIIAASFKNISQVLEMIDSGSQAATVNPDILKQIFKDPSIDKAIDDFRKDWESVYHKDTL